MSGDDFQLGFLSEVFLIVCVANMSLTSNAWRLLRLRLGLWEDLQNTFYFSGNKNMDSSTVSLTPSHWVLLAIRQDFG